MSLFAIYWRIATESATVTLLSLLTSPMRVLTVSVSAAFTIVGTAGVLPAIIAADERTASSFFTFELFILIKLLIIDFVYRIYTIILYVSDYKSSSLK